MFSMKIVLFVLSLSVFTEANRNVKNMFTIQVKEKYTDKLIEDLEKIKFYVLYKITSSVYIFKYSGHKHGNQVIEYVEKAFSHQIIGIEQVRTYDNNLKPTDAHSDDSTAISSENLVCSNYYGMGVQQVWAKGITGKGVKIAIVDVGINTDLIDLKRNIGNCELCKNFSQNSTDVAPESFKDSLDKPPSHADHGNKVASIVAAEKDNNICSAGIAYDATIVVIKAFELVLNGTDLSHRTHADSFSMSLKHEIDKIDIFVNSVALSDSFDKLDIASNASIALGSTKGREGLGTIYVVPAGPVGNALSHNRHTITVNCIGKGGTKPDNATIDTSSFTSGLRDGNNISASSMVTVSHGNKCIRDFKGLSAAVSQVSSIIALGLQANPKLSLRDVQHILVKASDVEQLQDKTTLRTNGACLKFHNIFGFGLLNADKFVQLALNHSTVPVLLSVSVDQFTRRITDSLIQEFELVYNCASNRCITTLEHVEISLNFTTTTDHMKVEIISPSNTSSIVMDKNVSQNGLSYSREGRIVTVHFWDEVPQGIWKVIIQNKHLRGYKTVHNISLTLYGTKRQAHQHMKRCKKPIMPRMDSESKWQNYLLFFLVISVGIMIWFVWYKFRYVFRKRFQFFQGNARSSPATVSSSNQEELNPWKDT